MKKARILLLNGPNLNLLGQRNPEHYGRFTLKDVEYLARETALSLGCELDAKQSNHEGQLIDWIQEARTLYAAIVINAAAYTHYSIAIGDALELFKGPKIEVHISDIHQREDFRKHSAILFACDDQISGHGLDSYRLGVKRAVELLGK